MVKVGGNCSGSSDPDAGQKLQAQIAAHHSALYRYARKLSRDNAVAQDLVQDTMERALKAAIHFQPGTNLRAWLLRILHNRFNDHCRHRNVAREIDIETVISLAAVEAAGTTYLDVISFDDVCAAVTELRGYLRQVFKLSYLDGLPYKAIAERLSISETTVGVRLWRARRALQQILEKRLDEAPPHARARRPGRRGHPAATVISSCSVRHAPGRPSTATPAPRLAVL